MSTRRKLGGISRDTLARIRGLTVFAVGLASGDQRRHTGSGSTSDACSRWCTIQIHGLLYLQENEV